MGKDLGYGEVPGGDLAASDYTSSRVGGPDGSVRDGTLAYASW